MKILCLYISITLLGSSHFYASDQSKSNLLQKESDTIHRGKMSHADTVVKTLRLMFGDNPTQLIVAYLPRTKVRTSKFHTLDYNISGIMSSKKNTTKIAVTFIKSEFTDFHKIYQGKTVYNHVTDTFSDIILVPSGWVYGYPSKAQTKLDNLDKEKPLSKERRLSNGTTIAVLPPRGICVNKYVDSDDTYLVDAYTRWLSTTTSAKPAK